MSLKRFQRPKLLDKHEAVAAAEKSVGKVEKAISKFKKIIKKKTNKN